MKQITFNLPQARSLTAWLALLLLCQMRAVAASTTVVTPDSPYWSAEEFREAIAELGVPRDQRVLFEAMHDELVTQYRLGRAEIERRRSAEAELHQRTRKTPADAGRRWIQFDYGSDWRQLVSLWKRERPDIERQFESDVGALLSADLARRWYGMCRDMRRGLMAANREHPFNQRPIDLIAIVGEIELSEGSRANIEPTLGEYAARLDEMLREFYLTRDLAIARSFEVRARWRENPDDRRLQRERERINAKIDELMDGPHRLNEEYTLLIAAELFPEEGRRFLDQVDVWTYPDLFMQSPTALALERLPEVEWLNPGQREQIDAIAERFGRELERVNRRIVRFYKSGSLGEDRQALRATLNAEGNWPPPVWPPADDPEIELRRERYLLTRAAMRRLRALFTDEEYEALPADLRLLLWW